MLELACDTNAIPLSRSLSWPTAAQKKSHTSTRMGPFHTPSYTYEQPSSAHQAHNGLPHRTVVWAHIILCSGIAAEPCAQIAPWCKCNAIVNELELAHSSTKEIMHKHWNGPISCTVIYTQAACIGPSSTQWAAAQNCCVGPHNFT